MKLKTLQFFVNASDTFSFGWNSCFFGNAMQADQLTNWGLYPLFSPRGFGDSPPPLAIDDAQSCSFARKPHDDDVEVGILSERRRVCYCRACGDERRACSSFLQAPLTLPRLRIQI
uniref:Uncharacterized protein n=1 Tax=Ananas comosus var. bracteatus TaxID=296719 RepID=A0A6V7PHJ2_ANACO|nr:unnamed protein product [Ananas comosus var. bracteatus]